MLCTWTVNSSISLCLLPLLCLHICKSIISMLLFTAASSWISVLWIVTIMSDVYKKGSRMGLTFSSHIVSVTLYTLLCFRSHFHICLPDSITNAWFNKNFNKCVRFHVLTVVSMKMTAFWGVAPCSLCGNRPMFQRCYCLLDQGDNFGLYPELVQISSGYSQKSSPWSSRQ
jgi:hypothetical protein